MMLKWVKSRFVATDGNGNSSTVASVALPDDVLLLMKDGYAYPVSKFISWLSSQPNHKAFYDLLCKSAEDCGWHPAEREKISAYYAYFLKHHYEAFQKCDPYICGKEIDPDYLGIASSTLFNTHHYDEAYRLLKRGESSSVVLKRVGASEEVTLKRDTEYFIMASLISWAAGDYYLANKFVDRAYVDQGEPDTAPFNGFSMYFELGDENGLARTRELLGTQISLHPNFAFSYAFSELAQNNYASGLELAESRYQMTQGHRLVPQRLFAYPRWNREEISEKTLLVYGEQGLGDVIQVARFFNDCQKISKKVVVECLSEAIALLHYNFPGIEFLPLSDEFSCEHFDLWVGGLSLPYIFKVTADSVPHRAGYLEVPPDHRNYWTERVNELGRSSRLKIGLAWSGYPGHRADRRRSIPWQNVKAMVEQYSDVDFYAVQTRLPEDLPSNLYDCTEELITLSDTAALIEQMDLIISVDTSVVHIAGAIGKETWMMLPYRYEWRWGLEGEDSNWYDSVKVIRQPAPGAWAPVLSRVFGRRLRNFLSSKVHSQ